MQRRDSFGGRNENENEVNSIHFNSVPSSSRIVSDVNSTYVEENDNDNEIDLTSNIEGHVDLTKEYGESS